MPGKTDQEIGLELAHALRYEYGLANCAAENEADRRVVNDPDNAEKWEVARRLLFEWALAELCRHGRHTSVCDECDKGKWVVRHISCDAVWCGDDGYTVVYESRRAADNDIWAHIRDCADAVKRGELDDFYGRDDFEVIAAETKWLADCQHVTNPVLDIEKAKEAIALDTIRADAMCVGMKTDDKCYLCKKCDHFVDEDGHMCDEIHHVPDDHHEAVGRESGHSLDEWKKIRPDLFVKHPDGLIGPNSAHHVTQLDVKPEWEIPGESDEDRAEHEARVRLMKGGAN